MVATDGWLCFSIAWLQLTFSTCSQFVLNIYICIILSYIFILCTCFSSNKIAFLEYYFTVYLLITKESYGATSTVKQCKNHNFRPYFGDLVETYLIRIYLICIIDSLIYLELNDSKIIKTVIIAIREQFANSRIYMNIFLWSSTKYNLVWPDNEMCDLTTLHILTLTVDVAPSYDSKEFTAKHMVQYSPTKTKLF